MEKRTALQRGRSSLLRQMGIIIVLCISLLLPIKVFASSNMGFDDARDTLPQGETVEGPGFFAGDLVRVDGTVNGTAFVAGSTVEVNGTINGDLFAAGQNLIITGEVTGNIYSAGMNVRLEGEVGQDAFLAGQTLTVVEDVALNRDLFMAGGTLLMEGQIQRHMYGAGDSIEIAGTIGGDANFGVNNLTLQETAVINGDLTYESDQEADIAAGATVAGETDFRRVERQQDNRVPMMTRERTIVARILGVLWSVLSALLLWFLVKLWRPIWWERTARPLLERPLPALGIGLVALLLTPLLFILLLITLIGIPLAFILMAVYGIVLYLSKIIVAVALAMLLDRRTRWSERQKGGWLVLLMLVVLGLLGLIPVVNFFVSLLVAIAGLGSFVLSHYRSDPRPVLHEGQ